MGLMKRLLSALSPEEVKARGEKMLYARSWTCGCTAVLKIRCRQDRAEGRSNFQLYPPEHAQEGQPILQPSQLTWEGMAEERGWVVYPHVRCPACQRGMTVVAYKQARRRGEV